jgi:Ca2+-binding RTX toxin-like protein
MRTLSILGLSLAALIATTPSSASFAGSPGRLAYFYAAELWSLEASGANARTLGPGLSPAWSPNGRLIAFDNGVNNNYDVWVMRADGKARRRVTRNPAPDYFAGWSPDGTRIVFTSDRGGEDLWTIRVDGTGERRLTTDPNPDWGAAWSPDGRSIAFDSDRSGNFEIYSISADGSDVRRLTSDPALDARPAWSPTGDSIAFQSDRQTRRGRQLWAVRATGGAAVQLTSGFRWVTSPDWQPVEFAEPCTVKGTIYAELLEGTERADRICGLAGSDRISDYGGKDRLEGGSGNDVLNARDGRRDVVIGGPGRDSATVDRIDKVIGVERVVRR